MTKKLKKKGKKILLSAAIFFVAIISKTIMKEGELISLLLFGASYLIVGMEVLKKAGRNIKSGQIFDENFLMVIATFGAFLIKEYPEAAAVMLFYQIGEWFQSYAVNNSRKSIKEMMELRPEEARVLREGKEIIEDPEEIKTGEIIIVKAGERIPLDGVIIEGSCSLDTMALTGESIPRDTVAGEEVASGCINLNSVIKIRVTKEFSDSTVMKILELVENATSNKAVTEKFITRFARYYTPIVVILALLLAVVPSVIFGNFQIWGYRALSFLVISCPCALVISIPLSFFGGIGGAGKKGILIKGSNYLESLAKAETLVLDKTGTLTKGSFEVVEVAVCKEGMKKEELLALAAHGEYSSNHPISKALQKAYGKETQKEAIGESEELPGFGVKASYKGCVIYVGNQKLMEKIQVPYEQPGKNGTICHIALELPKEKREYLGYVVIADRIKEEAEATICELKRQGLKRIVMLTGDRREEAKAVAEKLQIHEYYADLLPNQKVEILERILSEEGKKVIFVGDGINDAPVLARADLGIAMGGLGADVSIEAADMVIMNDRLSKIVTGIKISHKTLSIVKENIVMAIGIKILVLILAALGITSMWAAVFADVGVAFLAILNAMRAMKIKEYVC